jgi:hypothetical protein
VNHTEAIFGNPQPRRCGEHDLDTANVENAAQTDFQSPGMAKSVSVEEQTALREISLTADCAQLLPAMTSIVNSVGPEAMTSFEASTLGSPMIPGLCADS